MNVCVFVCIQLYQCTRLCFLHVSEPFAHSSCLTSQACPEIHTYTHTLGQPEEHNLLYIWENTSVFVSCLESRGSAKIKLFQVPSMSVCAFKSCRLFHLSGLTLWPVAVHTEAHFLFSLSCNEKQRAALSSAGNNAALGPHGSLMGSLLYIQTFDLHQKMYNAITRFKMGKLFRQCVLAFVVFYTEKCRQHCDCLNCDNKWLTWNSRTFLM